MQQILQRGFRFISQSTTGAVLTLASVAALVAGTVTVSAQVPIGTFAAGGTLASLRALHEAVALPDGRVFIYGSALSAEIYDPASKRTEILSLPTRDLILSPKLTALRDGKVLITGGFRVDPTTRVPTPISTALVFDPAAQTWTTVGPMTVARAAHSATLLGDGRVLIVGGGDHPTTPTSAALRTSEIYDPTARQFTKSGSLTADIFGHTGTLLKDGRVLIAGDGGYLFDPTAGTFSVLAASSARRIRGSAVLLQDGSVILIGGTSQGTIVSGTERFDPATGRFSSAGSMAKPREGATATLLPNGQVLVIGGISSNTTNPPAMADTEVYDSATNAFRAGPPLVSARAGHTATLLGDGRIVLAGGVDTGALVPSIEVFTPTVGAKPYAGTAPGAGSQGLLVTTRGVSADDIVKAATSDGCTPRVVATLQAGSWRIYLPGAPAAVNSAFPASLPASTPLFVGCN